MYFFEETKVEDYFQLIKFEFEKNENIISIEDLCNAFEVSKSGYYSWCERKNNPSKKEIEKQKLESDLMEKFRKIIKKVGHVPGKRTFQTYLDRDYDMKVSVKECARVMKKMSLVASLPHKDAYKGQATYNHVCASIQDKVKRNFGVSPRTVILTDITYLYYGPNRELFYLCAFKDAYTCEILGKATSKHMNVELVKDAYNDMMNKHKNTFKKDVAVYIHHDQGSQYLSTEFKQILSDDEFIQSCSRRGNSQDNAPMESFFGRLKTAIIDILVLCKDYETASELTCNHINDYNNKHYQYNLGGLTPSEFYLYCITGIYSLSEYCGIPKEKLNSIESCLLAREKAAKEKREKINKSHKESKPEKGDCINPIALIKRDKKVIQGIIDELSKHKKLIDTEINKYNELLSQIYKAEEFVTKAKGDLEKDLTNPGSWCKYNELKYVEQMNGLF